MAPFWSWTARRAGSFPSWRRSSPTAPTAAKSCAGPWADAAWRIELVKRSAQAKGFEVIPRRWVVERTIAWINRCRRLAKDYENLNRTAIAFIRLASIRLMLRRLTRYCYPS